MDLDHLVKQQRQHPLSRSDWEQLASVARAMAATLPSDILAALECGQSMGVDLCQVGALALAANRRGVARVLRDHFSILPHHYLTTGGETGIDASEGYPLLAHLAFMDDAPLLTRALEWGADPDARWEVARLVGFHHEREDAPQVISWVGECIRGLSTDFLLEKLLPVASPPSPEEEVVRLRALHRSFARAHRHRYIPWAALLGAFAPGGTHALAKSFWEASEPGASYSLGMVMAMTMARSHAAITESPLPHAERWLIESAPADGQQQLRLLLDLVDRNNRQGNFPAALPAWCIQDLDPSQLGRLCEAIWSSAIEQSASARRDMMGRKSTMVEQLPAALEHYKLVLADARRIPPSSGAFDRIIAACSLPVIQGIPPEGFDAIVSHWPAYFPPVASHPLLLDLRDIATRRQVAEEAKDYESVKQSRVQTQAAWERAHLATITPQASNDAARPRL